MRKKHKSIQFRRCCNVQRYSGSLFGPAYIYSLHRISCVSVRKCLSSCTLIYAPYISTASSPKGGGGQAHLRTRPLLGRWKMCPSRGLPFKGSRCRRLRGGGAGVEGWKEGLRHYSRGRKVLQPLVLGGRTQRSCDRRGNSR